MRRREFIAGLAGAAVPWPLSAPAQQQGGIRRIGFLCSGLASEAFGNNIIAAFTQGLGALGWKVDVNLRIDWRWYGADAMLAERQATELIALKPDVLVAGGNPAVERLAEAGIEPSVGSVGDSYDNALAETINGLYKAEVIHRRGPWRSFETVEFAATLDLGRLVQQSPAC